MNRQETSPIAGGEPAIINEREMRGRSCFRNLQASESRLQGATHRNDPRSEPAQTQVNPDEPETGNRRNR